MVKTKSMQRTSNKTIENEYPSYCFYIADKIEKKDLVQLWCNEAMKHYDLMLTQTASDVFYNHFKTQLLHYIGSLQYQVL